jgi:hypothetical protein
MTIMALMGKVGGAAAAPAEVMKIVTGLVQAKRAKDLRDKTDRPIMGIPQGVQEAVGTARNAYQDPRMAAQQYFLDQVGANQATATRGAYQMGGSAAERQNAAIMGQSGANSATNQLAAQAAQRQATDTQALMSQLGQLGQYQQQAWQYNQADPYAEAQAAAMREGNAANANIYGGLKGLGGAAMSAFTPQQSAGATGGAATNGMQVPDGMVNMAGYQSQTGYMPMDNSLLTPDAQLSSGYTPMGIATTNPDGTVSYDRDKSRMELQNLVKMLGGK